MLKADVIEHFKSAAITARALNISHVAVAKWGPVVPWGSAYQIECITGGALKVRRELYLRHRPVSASTLKRRLSSDGVKSGADQAKRAAQ
jgi:hypothetical protein